MYVQALLLLLPCVVSSVNVRKAATVQNATQTGILTAAREKFVYVKDVAKQMAQDVFTKGVVTGSGKSLGSKLNIVNRNWRQTIKDANNATNAPRAAAVGKAITGVGTGMVGFVNGIKNGDWVGGVQGALTIVSSVVALAGPVGLIISSILSLVSSIFSLFGGSAKEESMDSKLERIVSEQVDIARSKNLKESIEGMKHTYRSMSASVQHFRDSGHLEKDQASEIYNQAFRSLSVFGKLRARINDICDGTKEIDDAKDCLDAVNMYAEISVIRQLILTDMASLMAYVHDKEMKRIRPESDDSGGEDDRLALEEDPVDEAEEEEEGEVPLTPDKIEEIEQNVKGLLAVANNLLNLIKKEQENDRTFLRFMGDPFNNPKRRYIISVFWSRGDMVPLRSYLRTLHANTPGGIFKDYVMICDEVFLNGTCNVLMKKNYRHLNGEPGQWYNRVKSAFIPLHFELTAWSHPEFAQTQYGPYIGPMAYSKVAGEADWDSVKIRSNNARDAANEVLMCEKPYFDPGYCDTFPVGKHRLGRYHGTYLTFKYKSMHVPKGLMVDGMTGNNFGGSRYDSFSGPHDVNLLYDEEHWNSINVTTNSTLDARNHVVFCDEEDLRGHCKTTWKSLYYLPGSYNMNWEGKIKSIKIPGGFHVTGYSEISHQGKSFGPYSGPSTISKLDMGDKWKSFTVVEFKKLIPDDAGGSGSSSHRRHFLRAGRHSY